MDIRFEWVGYQGSDWYRLYVDDVVVYEGHPLDATDMLDLVKIEYSYDIEPREVYEARVARANAERKAASNARRKAEIEDKIARLEKRKAML